ncbi:MAG: hypothetical protein AAF804_07555, partial [Bacteroidota bacterium]
DSSLGGTHLLYRSQQPYGPWQEIATSLTGDQYVDDSPLAVGTYYYSLKTQNAKGESFYFSQAGMVEKQLATVDIQNLDWAETFHPFIKDLDQLMREYEVHLFDLAGRQLWQGTSQADLHRWALRQDHSQAMYVWQLRGNALNGQEIHVAGKWRRP